MKKNNGRQIVGTLCCILYGLLILYIILSVMKKQMDLFGSVFICFLSGILAVIIPIILLIDYIQKRKDTGRGLITIFLVILEYLNYTVVAVITIAYFKGSVSDPLIFLGGGAFLSFFMNNVVGLFSNYKKEQIDYCLLMANKMNTLYDINSLKKFETYEQKKIMISQIKDRPNLIKECENYIDELTNILEKSFSFHNKNRLQKVITSLELKQQKYSSWKRKFLVIIAFDYLIENDDKKILRRIFFSLASGWALLTLLFFTYIAPQPTSEQTDGSNKTTPFLEDMQKINNLKQSHIIFIKEQK